MTMKVKNISALKLLFMYAGAWASWAVREHMLWEFSSAFTQSKPNTCHAKCHQNKWSTLLETTARIHRHVFVKQFLLFFIFATLIASWPFLTSIFFFFIPLKLFYAETSRFITKFFSLLLHASFQQLIFSSVSGSYLINETEFNYTDEIELYDSVIILKIFLWLLAWF